MDTNNQLTNENVEQITEFLEENKPESAKLVEEAKAVVEVDPNAELEEADIIMAANSAGKLVEVQTALDNTEDYSDLFEDGKIPEVDLLQEEVSDEAIIKSTKGLLDISEEDALVLLDIIKEYKSLTEYERDKYKCYSKLPQSFKDAISQINGGSGSYQNQIAKDFIEAIIKDAVLDNEVNKVKDLMGSIAKELDLTKTVDLYTKYQKGMLETNLREHAVKLREEGNIEKAEQLDRISDAYVDSYTFNKLIDDINTNPGKYKIKKIELEKMEARVYTEFERKYADSQFQLPNIREASAIAKQKLTQYSEEDIDRFFIVFCKYCRGYSPENIEQHTFMYYGLMNIITLNFEDVNEDNEFAATIKANVSKVIDLIKEKYN